MSTCTNCGRELSGTFCSGCGTPASEQSGHAADAEEALAAPATATPRTMDSVVDDGEARGSGATTVIAPTPTHGAAEPVGLDEQIETGAGSGGRRTPTWIPVAIGVLVTAIIAAVIGLVVVPSDEPAAPTETSTTTATEATSTTETTTTTEATTTTTAAAPTAAPARNVLDEPGGQFCRDLNAKGYTYAEAVSYWEHHGRPSQMDASGSGIPCQTVYPRSEVEARWGSATTSVDLNSPLLWGYADAVQFFNSNPETRTTLAEDLSMLTRSTSTVWTQEMLLALGSSACNDWEMLDDGTHTGRGEANWAAAIAPVLGVSESAALTAIQSNVWWNYQFVCA